MKRVAIFASCDSFEGFYGGTFGLDRETFLQSYRNDFIWEYARGLGERGHQVFIYILSYGPPLVREISERISVRFLPLTKWLRPFDAALFRLRNVAQAPMARDRVAYAGYGAALQRALREDRIDVLYHQEIWTPRFDVVVEQVKVPVIGADQGAVYAEWMAARKRRSLPAATLLLCQSILGLDRARALGGDPQLAYNGIDTEFFQPPDSPESRKQTILAVGRFVEAQKRFTVLLQAMQLLPEFELILVGSGPDEAMLKGRAAEYGVAGRVRFAGFVKSREELRRLYQECGVFVSSSSWEAVALVMLEAMSCGAAVVGTRIPSFEDLLSDGINGLLVSVGDREMLADAVRRAWQGRTRLGLGARDEVENRYSSAALYQRLSLLIEGM